VTKKKQQLRVTEFPANLTGQAVELNRLTSLDVVAKRTELSVPKLRDLLRSGSVFGDKVGGTWVTSVAAVEQYKQQSGTAT